MTRWRQRYAGFAAQVSRAEAEAEVGHVARVAKAAQDGDCKASAWWLERRRHADWRGRTDVNLNAKVEDVGLSDDVRAERIAALLE